MSPGGNTLFPQFKERLERDLADSVSVSRGPSAPPPPPALAPSPCMRDSNCGGGPLTLLPPSPRSQRQLMKVKIHAPAATTERRFSVWIGGSILASLGSFQQYVAPAHPLLLCFFFATLLSILLPVASGMLRRAACALPSCLGIAASDHPIAQECRQFVDEGMA